MAVFINFSNHRSASWSYEQLTEAQKYGEIVDVAFPELDTKLSEDDIRIIGNKIVDEIASYRPAAVMCQGEYTLTHYVVNKLVQMRIECVSACTKRITQEKILDNGTVQKESYFEFEGFRKYV